MPPIPAICKDCGRSFAATGIIGGGFGSNVIFTGNTTNCPFCGGEAALADFQSDSQGRVTWLHGFYSALAVAKASRSQVAALLDALTDAREKQLSQAQTLAQVEAKAPELKGVLALATPKNTTEFWAMMAVLMPFLTFLLGLLMGRDEGVHITNEVNNYITNQVNNYITQQGAPAPTARAPVAPTAPTPRPKSHQKRVTPQPRSIRTASPEKEPRRTPDGGVSATPRARTKGWKNARCSCGSGKRARECHGAAGPLRASNPGTPPAGS